MVEIVLIARDVTKQKLRQADLESQMAAISSSQAVVSYTPDGQVMDANPVFLQTMGYHLEDFVGQHHRLFTDQEAAARPEYNDFWAELQQGRAQQGEFKRIGNYGVEAWWAETYAPIRAPSGRIVKVIEFATDVTKQKLRDSDLEAHLAALGRIMCVASFLPDGTLFEANARFLQAMGYTHDELLGQNWQHHRLFVDPAVSDRKEYSQFWAALREGVMQQGEFKRIRKGGAGVWLDASYMPIFDPVGQRVVKIVQFAWDVTAQKLHVAELEAQVSAMRSSQAVAAFLPDGTLVEANPLFLQMMGSTREKLLGKHHRLFVSQEAAVHLVYESFWLELQNGKAQQGEFQRVEEGRRGGFAHSLLHSRCGGGPGGENFHDSFGERRPRVSQGTPILRPKMMQLTTRTWWPPSDQMVLFCQSTSFSFKPWDILVMKL